MAPLRVLLVEDEEFDAAAATDALRDVAIIQRATALAEACDGARSADVALLDLGLPDSRGLDTLVTLRRVAPDLPIVVLTGVNDEELGAAALRAGAQDYVPKIRLQEVDLARTLRYAIERGRTHAHVLALQRELARHEQLAANGRIAAGLAHEINNPLFVITMDLTLLREAAERALPKLDPNERRALASALELSASASAACTRISELIARLYRLGPNRAGRESVDVGSLIEEIAAARASASTPIDDRLPPLPPALCDAISLKTALENIVANACDAVAELHDARVGVDGHLEGDRLVIEIHDNGPGMPRDVVERAFEPFFSTKPRRVGLGLSIARALVNSMDGEIKIRSSPSQGTTCTLELPVARQPARAPGDVAAPERAAAKAS